ncbi:hypothetical protein [Acidisphaera sp. S103]|uniref:hypothetical protein n=1 Tax=Acidisphaera sp. S103 TaxID=1747223 RepID=UPI00131E97CC|nr:hypothetical protein [Acidisphaera sp. S103]
MSRFLGLLLLSALSVPALAADPPTVKAPHQHHPRMTWEAHFAQANLAHDGHLTMAEAKGGDTLVAKHFDEIDATHRGYVTEDDIRAWREQHKSARHRTKTGSTKHRGTTQETPVAATGTAGGSATVAKPSNPPAAPGDMAGGATRAFSP